MRCSAWRRGAGAGQSMVEYAIILVLAVVLVIAVLIFLGPLISTTFSNIF